MNKIIPPQKLTRFKWGGKTYEWLEEAKELNAQIQDAKEEKKSKEEVEKEVFVAEMPQYWN